MLIIKFKTLLEVFLIEYSKGMSPLDKTSFLFIIAILIASLTLSKFSSTNVIDAVSSLRSLSRMPQSQCREIKNG